MQLDVGVAPAQLAVGVVGRQRQLDAARLPGLHAAQRALDLLERAPGAELHEIADGRGLGHRLAAGADVHVDLDEVARLGLALDRDERRGLLAQALELGVDLVGGHLDLVLHALELEVGGQDACGAQRELGRERERLALRRHALEIDARAIGRVQAGHRDGLADPRGEMLAHRLLEHLLAAHALQHDGGRHLARAEARVLGAVDEMAERVVEVVLDPFRLELDLQARAPVVQHCGRRPHRIRTLDDSGKRTCGTLGVRYGGRSSGCGGTGRRAGFRFR